MPDNEVVTFA